MAISRPSGAASSAGFSLVEVLTASTVFVVGIAAVAGLSSAGARANAQARTASAAALLAMQKIEQLTALAWTFDELGEPLSDTTADLTVFPPAADGGVGLTPSPADALERNTAGYCDFLDTAGRTLGGGGTSPPAQTAFVRRWSITLLTESPVHTIVLQALVVREAVASRGSRAADAVRIVAAKTRKAP